MWGGHRRAATLLTVPAAIAAFAVGLMVGLIISEPQPGENPGGTPLAVATPPEAADEVLVCTELAGRPTTEVVEQGGVCEDTGHTTLATLGSFACTDGRTLFWNTYGWGYSDGAWHGHQRPDGQLVPPQADLDACQTG